MAGCLRSAVLLALRSKILATIGRLPGLFEKLHRFFNICIRAFRICLSLVKSEEHRIG